MPADHRVPGPEEAFETLKHLADLFLQSAPRSPRDIGGADEGLVLHRPATVVADDAGRIQALDSEAERLFGWKTRDIVNSPSGTLFGRLPVDGEQVPSILHRHDGTELSVWISRADLTLAGKMFSVLTFYERDMLAGRQTELRYRHLVEQIPAVVFTAALDGGLFDVYVSPQIESLLGYSQAEWVADPVLWYERLHVDDRRKLDEEFARGCLTGGPFKADCRFLTHDNEIVWVHGEARLIRDSRGLPLLLQGVAFNITETKRAEEIARASLLEKETLLKEIHHRVKNNLQVTSSLLKLQADRIEDPSARKALQQGQSRIRSMALVHELLYRSKDLSQVDLGDYVRDLTRQLLRSHAVEPSLVRVQSKLAPVPIAIDLAVPCGLILNELVSNALKHAFPEGRRGTVHIELNAGDSFDDLVVRDDGVGFPGNVDPATTSTLGLRLIRTLADQIEAKLEVRSSGGTEIRLRIPRRQTERQ
jgi:PAS domain S-box-containing protein